MSVPRRIGRMQLRRVLNPIPATFHAAGGVRAEGELWDISVHGLFFATSLLPPTGTYGSVVFEFPPGTVIEVRGEVRWNTAETPETSPGFGMEIESVPRAYQELCEQLLKKLPG